MYALSLEQQDNMAKNQDALWRTWGIPASSEPPDRTLPSVALESGAQGQRCRVQATSGRWVSVHGRFPVEEATAWWAGQGVRRTSPTAPVVMIGAGVGYEVAAALDDPTVPWVLVVEPDPDRAAVLLGIRDWRDRIEQRRVAVLVGPDYLGRSDVARALFDDERSPAVVPHPVLAQAFPAETLAAAQLVKELVSDARLNRHAREVFAERYLRNTLANVHHLVTAPGVTELRGVGGGLAAIVAGAGPSLNRNIAELLPFRDRAIVIAAGSAVRPLQHGGLEPDINVALDPADLTTRNLEGSARGSRAVLVAEGSVPDAVFAPYEGRRFAFRVGANHPWPWLNAMGLEPGTLRAWGSVITAATDLAVQLGCDPIVMIGADHGYTENQPYCRQTPWEEDWRYWESQGIPLDEVWRTWKARQPLVTVSDIHGHPIETARQLLAYRDWLVEASVRAAPTRFINATGAGTLAGGRFVCASPTEALSGCPSAADALRRLRAAAGATKGGTREQLSRIRDGAADPRVWQAWANAVPQFDQERAWSALESGLEPRETLQIR